MTKKNLPIAILSFSRPDYLSQTLESLRRQDEPLDGRTIALFQDGPWSPSLKKNHVNSALCRRCVEVFNEHFPDGLVFESSINLGAALNFERAESYVFETLNEPAAIFLEDDLVLGRSYLTILERLIDLSLVDERIGYVAAFGNWMATPEEQLQGARKLRPLHYQWGFGLTQRQWLKCRPYIQAYLDIVSRRDYRQRDHATIQALVRSWGLEPADPNLPVAERAKRDTSQDRIKAFATALVGCVSLNTETVYGQYIGKEGGLHFNTEIFEKFQFHKTRHFDEALTLDFDLSSVNFDPFHPATHVWKARKQDTALSAKEDISATTSDVAQWARALYRIFLMREADPIGLSAHVRSLRAGTMMPEQLIRAFLQSTEFRKKSTKFIATYLNDLPPQPEASPQPRFVPLSAMSMSIESDASAVQLSRLIARIGQAWTHLGNERPYHSVLTNDAFLPANLNETSIEAFFASGLREASDIKIILARHGFTNLASAECVEYGSGVGRVTMPLAAVFGKVHAYDISRSHLNLAKERASHLNADNVSFNLVTPENFMDALTPCDFFFSRIVFQHNPPPVISNLISRALTALRPGGVAVFQVPTYAPNYRFCIDEYLGGAPSSDMEMHALPQSVVFDLIANADCRLLEVREDGWIGLVGKWISNTFIVRRDEKYCGPV